MLTLRRVNREPRVEIMPLIDVIFLLLTFFIYAMVLMVRAELMPMQLQVYASGESTTVPPAATISLTLDGSIHFNREPVTMDAIVDRVREAQRVEPGTIVYLALEAGEGTVDRGPVLTELWDRLTHAGLKISFVGHPKG